jgi:hypothetical protein
VLRMSLVRRQATGWLFVEPGIVNAWKFHI